MRVRKLHSKGYISIYCDICQSYLVTPNVIEEYDEIYDIWYECPICKNKLHPKKDWYKILGNKTIEEVDEL